MNKRTIYTLPKDTEPTGDVLFALINSNTTNLSIFQKLESYVDDNPQIDRKLPNDLLTINNFAQYITDVNVGYLLGNAVDYKSSDKTTKLDPIIENYNKQSINELDTDLGEDLAMFGQAFENVFVDETSNILSAKLSVYNTIVVYDNTFKHDKMFAIYYAQQYDAKGNALKDQYSVTIWTSSAIVEGNLNKDVFSEETNTPHFFGEVPVIHYMNNKRMKGDYEPVISLIDAYNILQSDRVIDREKLVDAILAFSGATLTEEDRQAIKDNRVVGLPEGGKAEYIIKQVNEADADVLRKTIAADIHKFSKTPDFTDDKFGNAPSGVSLKYKILSLEWNAGKKEMQFAAGLKDRMRLYVAVMTAASKASAIDLDKVTTVFTRSLPTNNLETSQMIANLDGLVSTETLIGQLDFVEDASVEAKKAKEESSSSLAPNNFGTNNFPPANTPPKPVNQPVNA